jgi:hypothetical protein
MYLPDASKVVKYEQHVEELVRTSQYFHCNISHNEVIREGCNFIIT